MAIETKTENKAKRPHGLQLDMRKKAVLTGVEEVISMTEPAAQVMTGAGGLRIDGAGMHIVKYNADEGLLIIEGTINKLQYTGGDGAGGKGFFRKMFK
ncbi:MAG: sporulation protein [Clostridiales bacterium]|jgi:sporulation protein YabP|nr:sporulation protein [Clostridiales bacterium]